MDTSDNIVPEDLNSPHTGEGPSEPPSLGLLVTGYLLCWRGTLSIRRLSGDAAAPTRSGLQINVYHIHSMIVFHARKTLSLSTISINLATTNSEYPLPNSIPSTDVCPTKFSYRRWIRFNDTIVIVSRQSSIEVTHYITGTSRQTGRQRSSNA